MRKPANINPIVQISEQIHINKILTESKLPEEKAEVEDELQIYETVVFDPEPMQYDLDRLINLVNIIEYITSYNKLSLFLRLII